MYNELIYLRYVSHDDPNDHSSDSYIVGNPDKEALWQIFDFDSKCYTQDLRHTVLDFIGLYDDEVDERLIKEYWQPLCSNENQKYLDEAVHCRPNYVGQRILKDNVSPKVRRVFQEIDRKAYRFLGYHLIKDFEEPGSPDPYDDDELFKLQSPNFEIFYNHVVNVELPKRWHKYIDIEAYLDYDFSGDPLYHGKYMIRNLERPYFDNDTHDNETKNKNILKRILERERNLFKKYHFVVQCENLIGFFSPYSEMPMEEKISRVSVNKDDYKKYYNDRYLKFLKGKEGEYPVEAELSPEVPDNVREELKKIDEKAFRILGYHVISDFDDGTAPDDWFEEFYKFVVY